MVHQISIADPIPLSIIADMANVEHWRARRWFDRGLLGCRPVKFGKHRGIAESEAEKVVERLRALKAAVDLLQRRRNT